MIGRAETAHTILQICELGKMEFRNDDFSEFVIISTHVLIESVGGETDEGRQEGKEEEEEERERNRESSSE